MHPFVSTILRNAAAALLAVAVNSGSAQTPGTTATPIRHLVVIFQENVSFDHYFATYPNAVNGAGEPLFVAGRRTPGVNGLSGPLLTHNPNSVQPFRLSRAQGIVGAQGPHTHNTKKAM